MTNKLMIGRVALAMSTAMACGVAWADGAKTCSASTLSGTYVFSATGYGMPTGVWAPKAIVEIIHFNGDETLVVPAATVANRNNDGQVVASPPNGTGTYTVNPDCTGTLAFTNGPSFNLAIDPKGNELWMIQTNPNNVLQGIAKRVSKG